MLRAESMDIEDIARQRYESKRNADISPTRKDGSVCSVDTDIEAACAEAFAAELFNQPFNATTYRSVGDGGRDFTLTIQTPNGPKRMSVDVVHLGMKGDGNPRLTGHLIINPFEPHRWARIYVVVRGCRATGFEIAGWTTHAELIQREQQDFGYGQRFAMHVDELYPADLLANYIVTEEAA